MKSRNVIRGLRDDRSTDDKSRTTASPVRKPRRTSNFRREHGARMRLYTQPPHTTRSAARQPTNPPPAPRARCCTARRRAGDPNPAALLQIAIARRHNLDESQSPYVARVDTTNAHTQPLLLLRPPPTARDDPRRRTGTSSPQARNSRQGIWKWGLARWAERRRRRAAENKGEERRTAGRAAARWRDASTSGHEGEYEEKRKEDPGR
ncbi:hypothetical protein B0H11DRAFT_1944087 [Mycena galericulata]|nr:hypothetical protein B0H11DRAFT_1944087 [Mycena galericulata]